MTAKPRPAQDEKGRFLSGNIGGGRTKGARSKLGEEFIHALYEDFQAHGAEVIETVRMEKPDQYLKVVASLLPKDINVSGNEFDGMSDAELIARMRDIDAKLRPLLDEYADAERTH